MAENIKKKVLSVLNDEAIGIAPVGDSSQINNIVYRVDSNLGIFILAETIHRSSNEEALVLNDDMSNELSKAMVEVLFGYLANYLSSVDSKDKIAAKSPEFVNFLKQSILGTDPIVIDAALHQQAKAQISNEGSEVNEAFRNIAKVDDEIDEETALFSAVRLQSKLPHISVNLEVDVFFRGGVHIAHRGKSRQFIIGKEIEQIVEVHHTGGLLNALDNTANFLQELESKTVALEEGRRLVILSQGTLSEGEKINFKSLFSGRRLSPKGQAKDIVKWLSRYNPGNGYVFVVDPYYEKKTKRKTNTPKRKQIGNINVKNDYKSVSLPKKDEQDVFSERAPLSCENEATPPNDTFFKDKAPSPVFNKQFNLKRLPSAIYEKALINKLVQHIRGSSRRYKISLVAITLFNVLLLATIIIAIASLLGKGEEVTDEKVTQKSKQTQTRDIDIDEKHSYALGEVNTIKKNYQLARKLYLEGDTGRSAEGIKLDRQRRIKSLLAALPYFEKLIKLHNEKKTSDPNVWFMKARTEYNLAKHRHDRANFSRSAIESYKTFESLVEHPTKSQKKTMVRNRKKLRVWAE